MHYCAFLHRLQASCVLLRLCIGYMCPAAFEMHVGTSEPGHYLSAVKVLMRQIQ